MTAQICVQISVVSGVVPLRDCSAVAGESYEIVRTLQVGSVDTVTSELGGVIFTYWLSVQPGLCVCTSSS